MTSESKDRFIIEPIGVTTVDWSKLLQSSREMVGRTISRVKDSQKLSVIPAYISCLMELLDRKSEDPLVEAAGILKHFSITFLIQGPREAIEHLIDDLDLTIHIVMAGPYARVAVVTGTLYQWRTAILQGCSDRAMLDTREICNGLMVCLERAGAGRLWHSHAKTPISDGTFILQ